MRRVLLAVILVLSLGGVGVQPVAAFELRLSLIPAYWDDVLICAGPISVEVGPAPTYLLSGGEAEPCPTQPHVTAHPVIGYATIQPYGATLSLFLVRYKYGWEPGNPSWVVFDPYSVLITIEAGRPDNPWTDSFGRHGTTLIDVTP